jgi:NADPH-dependent glutamate synthase beta subunit-like oxidoreductase
MPEEINRVLTDHLSEVLFAPTEISALNLKNEKVFQRPKGNILWVLSEQSYMNNDLPGKVIKLELTQMRLDKFDRSGRKQPKPILGSEFAEKVETVISAISQNADIGFLPKESGIEINQATVKVNKDLRTTNDKVWAGGDVVTGPAMVIDAIQAGQQTARKIDETIRLANDEKPWVPPAEEMIAIPFEVDEETKEQPQSAIPEVSPELRRKDFREVELGYTLEMALAEARRCMRCDANIE